MAGKISNKLKTRLPARNGLGTEEPEHQKVTNDIANVLLGQIGSSGKLYKLSGGLAELEGYYRLELAGSNLFLKVIPELFLAQQLEANRFATFVKNNDLLSNTIVPGFPRTLDDELVVIAYEWINGRCLDSTPSELEQFGHQLGRLHQVLRQYPGRKKVSVKSFDRLAALRNTAKRIASLEQPDTPYLRRLCELLKANLDIFKPFKEPCQIIHGDLNVGNLRWSESGIVFLDFEDARHSWFPPRIDVAFALERLALINEPDNNRALENAIALLKGYRDASDHFPFSEPGSIRKTLEWLSIRSLCMLQHFDWEGNPWPESEWMKFDNLLDHMASRSEMLLKIENFFFGQ